MLDPVREKARQPAKCVGGFRLGRNFLDHLTVIGGGSKKLSIELNDHAWLEFDRLPEILHWDFGTLRHADLIEHEHWWAVIGACRLQLIGKVLCIPQAGEIRHGGHDDMIGLEHDFLDPARP